jgi:hypothetical protein
MARLAQFSVNAKAIEEGEWVRPDEDRFDDLEIRTRGFTNAFRDAQNRKLQRAARGFGGDVSKVPTAQQDAIRVECLIDHAVQDVRNLIGPDGQQVKFEQFCSLLRDPAYGELVLACILAAGKVGRIRDDEVEDASKN